MDEFDDGREEPKFEVPWLGFVDVTSATLASVMVLVMVFGLTAGMTMAAIQASERVLYQTGLIYPFEEYREYQIRPNNGWRKNASTLTYEGKWAVPVLEKGGGDYIYQQIQQLNSKQLSLLMTIIYNPSYTHRGAALESGYDQINEIRKKLADLSVKMKVTMKAQTNNEKSIGKVIIKIEAE